MIEYGVACLLVCALTYFDRRATPYALTIFAGWILGFLGPLAWPWISAASLMTLFWLNKRAQNWRWIAVSMIAGAMLALDLLYFWLRAQDVQIEEECATALNVGLSAQLLLIGCVGAWNGIVLLGSWGRSYLRGRNNLAFRRLGWNEEARK